MVFPGRGMGPPNMPPTRSMGGFMSQAQGRGLFSAGQASGRGMQSMFGNRGMMPGGGGLGGPLRGMQAGVTQAPKRGLLSSLLNRGGSGIGAGSNFGGSAAGAGSNLGSGVAGAASSGGGFQGVLSNMQQMVRLAQTATPMVQQYGPMVKNLPAMFKMAKALKDSDDVESTDESEEDAEKVEISDGEEDDGFSEDGDGEFDEFLESESSEKENRKKVSKKKSKTKKNRKKIESKSHKSTKTKESVPKLFV